MSYSHNFVAVLIKHQISQKVFGQAVFEQMLQSPRLYGYYVTKKE
jgi:hypothetical protein